MNKTIEQLEKTQRRARVIANMRDANERKWAKLYEAARATPEWKEYCRKTGCCESYNYGDLLC